MIRIDTIFSEVDPRYFYMEGDILAMKNDRWVVTSDGDKVYIPKKKAVGTGWLDYPGYYIHEIKGPIFRRLKVWNRDPIIKLKIKTGEFKIFRVSDIERRIKNETSKYES